MIVGEVGAIAPVTTVRRTFCGPGADSPAKQRHTRVLAARCHTPLGHSPTRKVDAMTTVRNVVLAAAAVAAMVVAAGTAGADPGTPQPPSPAYQIPTPGGGSAFPGVQPYPPICGVAPLACALHYDAGTGTWQPTSAG